jgi:hypothetical protein
MATLVVAVIARRSFALGGRVTLGQQALPMRAGVLVGALARRLGPIIPQQIPKFSVLIGLSTSGPEMCRERGHQVALGVERLEFVTLLRREGKMNVMAGWAAALAATAFMAAEMIAVVLFDSAVAQDAYRFRFASLDLLVGAGEAPPENRGWLENHHLACRDLHLYSSLRISTHPRSLAAHHERAKRGQLHHLTMLKTIGDFFEHKLHQCCRLRPR